jgi:hypothetical protein
MSKERVLITVKTYPTLSRKYGETVCTAGIRADGSWVRLYPIPFRRLDEVEQYKKFDWIELDLVKGRSDPRPETHHPVDAREIRVVGHIGTDDHWHERRRLILKTAKVFDRLKPLLEAAKVNTISLAVFKPARILDFVHENCDRDWAAAKVEAMRSLKNQGELFTSDEWRQTFELMPKLPYNFSYRFADADNRESKLQVLDWEVGQLFWSCMRKSGQTEDTALAKVRQKYLEDFASKDLHFLLGTLQQFHGFSVNPWVIIGVLPMPHDTQLDLL